MTLDLIGQTAVVTGGGHGLGRACALDLAARGAHVVVNDIEQLDGSCSAHQVAAEVRDRGGQGSSVAGSVATPEGVAAIAADAQRHGGATVLVHAAGIVRRLPLSEVDLDLLRHTIAVNLTGSVLTCQALLPQMRAAGRGRVVLLGSGAGMFGLSGQVVYGATKAGQVGLARNLAHETRDEDIRVNVVLPYAITNPGRTRLEWDPEDLDLVATRADPAHVTPLVTMLVGPDVEVTGRVYSAFGGRYARVLTMLGQGWVAPDDVPPTPEVLRSRFADIDSADDAWEPASFEDELTHVARRLRG